MKISILIIAILSLFSTSSSQGIVLEYAINHLNEMYPSKILTCKDQLIELIAPDDNNPENCYLWQPAPDQFKYQRIITVEPQITTDYSIQITNYTTGENHIYFITVYVIDHIELYELNNIQECMERRSLVLKGELIGERMNEISYSDTKKAFIHFRRLINNNFYPDHKWFPVVGGKFSNILLAPSPTEPFHTVEYYAVLKGPGLECISNPVSLKVHRLWIEKFKDPESPQDHFVVVDRSIHHEALASPDCTNYDWKLLGSLKSWPLSNKSERQSNQLIIQNTGLLNTKTSDFGKTNGIIFISCKDETGQKYVTFSDFFNSPNNGNSSSINEIIRVMPSAFRASVFFKKDEPHPKYNYYIPNWFEYWVKSIHSKIEKGTDKYSFIDLNDPNNNQYLSDRGFYTPPYNPQNGLTPDCVYLTKNASETKKYIFIDYKSGKLIKEEKTTGIHTSVNTIYHEQEHRKIWFESWPYGYEIQQDLDLDLYNDTWEKNQKKYNFSPDRGIIPDLKDKYDVNNNNSNGTLYEEIFRCGQLEISMIKTGKIKDFDSYDWSYDPNSIFQGKQWK